MSTALDLASLAAQGELKIPIARGVVSQGGSGTDYTGWSGVSSVFVEAKVEVREQSRGFATLTLTVEGSSNGSDWSTLETFNFGHGGTQSATVSAPSDHLRVSWAVGGHSEWQIIEVTAAPSVIDFTTDGGSQPVTQERVDSFTEVATDTPLNWATGFGDDLLDFSDPAAPTVIDAGTYALSLFVFFGAFTSGSWMHIDVEMDADNDDWDIHNTAPLVAGASNTGVGVAITAKIPAGAKLVCALYSDAVLPGGAGATMRGQIAKIA